MKTEDSIIITVDTQYLYTQSFPADNRYAFAYTITISNTGTESVQLLSRHWIITDGNEQIQEVKGEGVIGKQPTIDPGKSFRYSSGCLLETPVGTMEGSYQMITEAHENFDAPIPCFSLTYPGSLH